MSLLPVHHYIYIIIVAYLSILGTSLLSLQSPSLTSFLCLPVLRMTDLYDPFALEEADYEEEEDEEQQSQTQTQTQQTHAAHACITAASQGSSETIIITPPPAAASLLESDALQVAAVASSRGLKRKTEEVGEAGAGVGEVAPDPHKSEDKKHKKSPSSVSPSRKPQTDDEKVNMVPSANTCCYYRCFVVATVVVVAAAAAAAAAGYIYICLLILFCVAF
jgi:hypothetical protein